MTREGEIWKAAMESSGKRDRIGGFYNGAKWADEHPKNPWRDAKTDPPKDDCKVLAIFNGFRSYGAGCYIDGTFIIEGFTIDDVYYWMPIPETPKGK